MPRDPYTAQETRNLAEKLEDMAKQTQSPREAEAAREAIKRILGIDQPVPPAVAGRTLSREAILLMPDREGPYGSMRVQMKNGDWAVIDLDEMDINFEAVTKDMP